MDECKTRTTPPIDTSEQASRMSRLSVGDIELRVASSPTEPLAWPRSLTPAEREVASLLIRGWSHAQIATTRRVTVDTVSSHVSSMTSKLGLDSVHRLIVALAAPRDE